MLSMVSRSSDPGLSSSEIASIDILKDAASAAFMVHNRGAGGVVLVTTKKAKEGAPSLTYDGTFGISSGHQSDRTTEC